MFFCEFKNGAGLFEVFYYSEDFAAIGTAIVGGKAQAGSSEGGFLQGAWEMR